MISRIAAALVLLLAIAPAMAAPQNAPSRSPPKKIELVFRLAPPETRVFDEGGEPVVLVPAANGLRVAKVEPGDREFHLEAEGSVPRVLRLHLPASGNFPFVEEKLENLRSSLILEGFGQTGPRPKSLSFTPDGRYLVLPLLSGKGADLLDARTLALVSRLEPPPELGAIEGFVETAFLPDKREIWISQMHNSLIHVFDLDSFAYKESFPSGGSYPKVIVASPDGKRAYVSNWVSENISVIDVATRKLIAKIKTGGTPRGLAPSPDGLWLYIARFSDGAILRLGLRDLKLETVYAPDGGAKRHLVLDPARKRLYATDMSRNSLFVFDTESWRLLAEIALGLNPNGCDLSPDGRFIFACTRGPDGEYGYEKKRTGGGGTHRDRRQAAHRRGQAVGRQSAHRTGHLARREARPLHRLPRSSSRGLPPLGRFPRTVSSGYSFHPMSEEREQFLFSKQDLLLGGERSLGDAGGRRFARLRVGWQGV